MDKHMIDKKRKYDDKGIIEPVRVIEERKKIGLHPSCPVPAGAIMCYDAAFWQQLCGDPENIESDGWLKGANKKHMKKLCGFCVFA